MDSELKILCVGMKAASLKTFVAMLKTGGYRVRTKVTSARRVGTDTLQELGSGQVVVVTASRRSGPRAPSGTGEPVVMNLRALRERVGKTQREVARRTKITQPQLSRLESRRDHLTSTLRRYIRALGGEIEIAAALNGTRVALKDV